MFFLRLDNIQERVESVLPLSPSSFEQIATWQKILHAQSSKKVQEYLDSNLEQIAKVK
jgi:predicted oxidoreductase (fatty acid repression mutant protein)